MARKSARYTCDKMNREFKSPIHPLRENNCPMSAPLVYIILVNWNQREVTLECLESLSRLTYPNFRIVVIDNASQDGSPAAIAAKFPEVEQIQHATNRGSTAGNNAGFRHALQAGADYMWLLNNDTVVAPDAVDHLVQHCQQAGVGMTSALVFYASAPDTVWSAGAMRSKWNLELIGDHNRNETFTSAIERDFLTSCALLVKREVIEKIGLMDEDYFIYFEEMDYCYKVGKAGYRLLLVPQAKVWHKVSASSGGNLSPFTRYQMAKNSILFFRKNASWWQWFFIIPWRIGNAIKISIKLAALHNYASLKSFWKGLLDGMYYKIHRT